ncbi:MAG: lysostaphin resistance A-like protein [Flavobacteriaceae bacterium]
MEFLRASYEGKNGAAQYIATLILLFLFWQVLGIIPLLVVAYNYAGSMSAFEAAAVSNFMGIGIPSNLYLILMLATFVFASVGLWIGITQIHKRKLLSLMTTRKHLDWSRIRLSAAVWFVAMLIFTLIDYLSRPEDFELIFQAEKFIVLLLVSILLIPIQTTFEEVLFRGYFMQALGSLAKNRWVPLLLTSVIFGLLHGANPEVAKLGPIMYVFYIGTGLFLGILTLMDEGMELSIGFHAINNVVSAILITTDWTVFQTNAIFKDTAEPDITWQAFLPIFIVFPILLMGYSKVLGWSNWKEKLFGHVA